MTTQKTMVFSFVYQEDVNCFLGSKGKSSEEENRRRNNREKLWREGEIEEQRATESLQSADRPEMTHTACYCPTDHQSPKIPATLTFICETKNTDIITGFRGATAARKRKK